MDGILSTHIRMVASGLPPLYRDDRVPLLEDAQTQRLREPVPDPIVDVDLPSFVRSGSGLVVEERVAASVQMDLSGRRGVSSEGEDGAGGAVLGDESGGVAAVHIRDVDIRTGMARDV